MSMDSSSFEEVALDPSKCSKMTMEEKRQLVYELSKRSHGASETLQSWTRQEILQILCAELGKERKYTGLTKLKIIENLFKIVADKNLGEHETKKEVEQQSSPASSQQTSKRQRKSDNPSRLPVLVNEPVSSNGGGDLAHGVYCKNLACRAILRPEDAFCKRCSCCICHQYDDNKDPSLWLICSSEPPFEGASCGMSCHLECALKHKKSGIGKDRCHSGLDGSFFCVPCGKVNDILGCWRKQLTVARDTRRVDILCYRVSLGRKLLKGTQKYRNLYKIVDEAFKKLEAEVGPLTGFPVKMGRGIVNRLSVGPEVQKICASALESLEKLNSESILSDPPKHDSNMTPHTRLRFEDVGATNLTLVLDSEDSSPWISISYYIWYRKAHEEYPVRSTCTLFAPNKRFVVTGLSPTTEYQFKVVSFHGSKELGTSEYWISTSGNVDEAVNSSVVIERSHSPATNCSSLSNPSSVEDETNNVPPESDQNDERVNNYKLVTANLSDGAERHPATDEAMPDSDVSKLGDRKIREGRVSEKMSNDKAEMGMECVPYVGCSESDLPITPSKMEIVKDAQGRSGRSKLSNKDVENGTGKENEIQNGSTSKKRSGERQDEGYTGNANGNGASDMDFEHCVKVIRWLECEGHIERSFRQKFLTWYSLRATPLEVRIVKVFIDTFDEDLASLAEQLVDTFSDGVSSKRSAVVPAGFCMKLWH